MWDIPRIKKPTAITSSILLAGLAGAFLWGMARDSETQQLFDETLPHGEHVALWQDYIEQHGGEEAYTFLVENLEARHLNGIDRHVFGHLFGEALYATESIEGFPICDKRTEYGCLHEIVSRTLTEHGLSTVYTLNDLCVRAFGELAYNCQHGIGHGLLVDTSYSQSARDKALATCGELPQNNFHSACNSGVFMEYMLHTSLGDANSPALPYRGDFLEPCRDLSSDMLAGACMMRLPDWWMETILTISTDQETTKALGEYCVRAGIELGINDSLCFSGIGNSLILQDEYNPESVVVVCDTASSDPEDQFWCKKVAAKHLLDGTTLARALRVCASMSGVYKTQCESEVHERNASNTSIPHRENLLLTL